ncbi:MAG: WYL domain-containing protein [Leptospiraceae bacterium]|nr:WYL domain-containing protein [Leptospiraceae bacterium]MCP5501187.1 WYL domain-containing protein [Leptospiraceae bacterium]
METEDIELGIEPRKINPTEERQLALVCNLLKSPKGLSFRQIRKIMQEYYSNENLDSDRKKLHRDMEELKELGFSIRQYESFFSYGQEDPFLYKIEDANRQREMHFSKEELHNLSLCIFKHYKSDFSKELFTASQKLFSGNLQFFPEMKNTDLESRKQEDEDKILHTIIKALKNKSPLKIVYSKTLPEKKETRTIEPLEIVKRNSLDFYLLAYDREKKDKRKFLIPKIQKVQEIAGSFFFSGKVEETDLNYHPLAFQIHAEERIHLDCDPENLWKLERFLYPHPYKKEGNSIILKTRNRSALYEFLLKEGNVILKTDSEALREGFYAYIHNLINLYNPEIT